MKTKLKIIIPIIVAVVVIIIAALTINFTSNKMNDINSLVKNAYYYLNDVGDFNQAIAEFNKIIELDPMNVDAYIGLAQAYQGKGDIDKAIDTLEKGIEKTGDQRLKDMLDELHSPKETTTTTVSDNEVANNASESSQTEGTFFENKVEYVDNWYSIFEYDTQEHLKAMSLYNDKGKKRVQANFTYNDGKYGASIYIDDVLYTDEYAQACFHDVIADREKELKNRAGTKQYAEDNNNWYEYDENGYCTSHGWHNLDQYGNLENTENVLYCNYDEKGYLIYGNNYDVEYIFHNDNSEPDMKMWHQSPDKFIDSHGAVVYYLDSHGVYGNNRDGYNTFEEYDKNGHLLRGILHSYCDYTDLNGELIKHSFMTYYIPSYDGNSIIGELWLDNIDAPVLFGCPYCE